MARNGSGSYSNPYPNFISGTVISSTQVDANNSDIATALTQSIAVDGQSVVTGDIPLATHKFTAMKVGSAATDSLSLGQAQAEAFVWCGTASGGADAITLAPSPAITAYAAGQRFVWMASGSTNTGATTVAISGLSAIALQNNGAALSAGQHAAGKMFIGILNTTSTMQIIQVQVSGTDPLIVSSLTVTGDATIGDDLTLLSDASILGFGEHTDVTITHVADSGLTLKNTSTADDTPFVLLVQTGETDIALDDALGKIQFQAPDEAAGTDAILVAAEIAAVSEGDFSASNNATKLAFKTGASEAATEKMSISSVGNVTMKETETGDDTPMTLLLQTGEIDVAVNDVLGKIQFQAPDEGAGTDAILVAAEIAAVSEGDFAADNNATKLSFKTGASEAATEKMSLSSGGNLTLPTDAAVVNFGANSDVTLTHVHDTGLLLNAAMQLQFRDGTEYIHSSADGQLDIDSATEVQIDTATLDINATTTVDIDTNADSSMMTLNNAHGSESQIGLLLTKASGAGYGAKFEAGSDVFLAGDNYSFFANGGELRNNNTNGATYICRFYNSDGTAKLNFYVKDDGTVNTGTDGGSPYNTTTALASNCNLVGTGLMRRTTSSLRFKSNVEPIDPAWADKLLELQPINYKSTAPADGDVDSAWTFYGFGAEDVAKVDPRYVFWNTHENVHDEATGENTSVLLDEAIPEGVQYDRMVPALIDIIKRLEKRVAVLEGLN